MVGYGFIQAKLSYASLFLQYYADTLNNFFWNTSISLLVAVKLYLTVTTARFDQRFFVVGKFISLMQNFKMKC